ncbi:hypothetical protein [Piscinibacter sakaiensis]|uniref:hypothetical protein n=1 Tax=Piscinibacter sakaiensis TaxID=1547922 RepID=UPI003AB0F512
MPVPIRLPGTLIAGLALVVAAGMPIDASAQVHAGVVIQAHHGGGHHWRGRHHHGHRGHGWAGLALGIGLGTLILSRPWEPVVVERPVPVYVDPPMQPPDHFAESRPVPPRPADPVVYPSHGQSAQQLEADRQACNRWATTQRDAMADASVFHRATLACLEGRGYTVR